LTGNFQEKPKASKQSVSEQIPKMNDAIASKKLSKPAIFRNTIKNYQQLIK
jgi:hypothetical protein